MSFSMICPWCETEKKPRPSVSSWEQAEIHLKGHGATEEQIAQAHESFQYEMRMHTHPFEAYAGCSEYEALGISPEDENERE